MRISNYGLALIKKFESCRLMAYQLKGETGFTIGWGHYNDPSVVAGTIWTQAHADQVLLNDLAKFEGAVEKFVTDIPLNQNRFDALVSYVYNRGQGGLRELVNQSKTIPQYSENIVRLWGKAERYKAALIRRREVERSLFDRPCGESVMDVARQVVAGHWGSGAERREGLVRAGYDYSAVQSAVNSILKNV